MNDSETGLLSFERIVFFSDAVFAIAITLLVLEIKVPHLPEGNGFSDAWIQDQLKHMIPKFAGFIASFFIIGLMWFEHHRIFQYIQNYDGGLIWRNLFFLLSISFIPFPTALASEYAMSRTAFIIYVLSFAFAGLTKLWIWSYAASKENLLAKNVEKDLILKIKRRSLAVPLGALSVILLSFISMFVAPLGFALIPLFAYLLDPTKRKTG